VFALSKAIQQNAGSDRDTEAVHIWFHVNSERVGTALGDLRRYAIRFVAHDTAPVASHVSFFTAEQNEATGGDQNG